MANKLDVCGSRGEYNNSLFHLEDDPLLMKRDREMLALYLQKVVKPGATRSSCSAKLSDPLISPFV